MVSSALCSSDLLLLIVVVVEIIGSDRVIKLRDIAIEFTIHSYISTFHHSQFLQNIHIENRHSFSVSCRASRLVTVESQSAHTYDALTVTAI